MPKHLAAIHIYQWNTTFNMHANAVTKAWYFSFTTHSSSTSCNDIFFPAHYSDKISNKTNLMFHLIIFWNDKWCITFSKFWYESMCAFIKETSKLYFFRNHSPSYLFFRKSAVKSCFSPKEISHVLALLSYLNVLDQAIFHIRQRRWAHTNSFHLATLEGFWGWATQKFIPQNFHWI